MNDHFMEEEKLLRSVWPDWKIANIIGAGTYGDVYEITKGDDKRAALKIISIPSKSEMETIREIPGQYQHMKNEYAEMTEHLKNEMMLMERLQHIPNIVGMEDYAVIEAEDGIGYYILMRMELLHPLRELVPMKEDMVIRLGIDISRALMVCQEENILHRDIKPGNILYNKYGDFKLGDFGIARVMDVNGRTLTRKMGTPMYMAPEVVLGKSYDFRSDLYSLGMVMYICLNDQKLPFIPLDKKIVSMDEREDAYIRRINGDELPPPAHASPELTEVIRRACKADPKERYTDASQMNEALLALKAERGAKDSSGKKKMILRIACCCLTALLLGVGIGTAIQRMRAKNNIANITSDQAKTQYDDIADPADAQYDGIGVNERESESNIVSITVIEDPERRRIYQIGEKLDIEGLRGYIQYKGSRNIEEKEITPDSDYYLMSAGEVSVPLEYEGFKYSIKVTVSTSLIVEKSEDDTYYVVKGISDKTKGKVIIPEYYNGLPVKEIGPKAFVDCSMREIVIPDTVETIGEESFWNCYELRFINIPRSVKDIKIIEEEGKTPFYCEKLESITVAEDNAVYCSKGDCLIDLRDNRLVLGCKNSVIPTDGSVNILGRGCFAYAGLKEIALPEGITRIEKFAFFMNDIRSLSLPSTIQYISATAFTYVGENLESIEMAGDGSGDYYVVDNCLIRRNEKKLLLGCRNSVITDDGQIVVLGDTCLERRGIESIVLPDCITEAGTNILSENYNLKSVVLPGSIRIISDGFFNDCSSLEKVVIPDTVTEIKSGAFAGCKSLKTIFYRGTEEQWNSIAKDSHGSKYLNDAEVIYGYEG